MARDACRLTFGPSTLTSPEPWKTYDVHIEPEPDCETIMEGKITTKRESALDLHFEAITKPFRPGTGSIGFGEHSEIYATFICITRMKVTGRLTINGVTREVTGSAYYNHQWHNANALPRICFNGARQLPPSGAKQKKKGTTKLCLSFW